jgi:phosphate transport system permease protein/phosphate transport system substrate-binding protein
MMTNKISLKIMGVSILTLSIIISLGIISLNTVHAQQVTINGAGATFPFPLIDTWRVEYQKVNPNVNINYASIGSGGGIKQFAENTVDFGATDAPLSKAESAKAVNPVHIPETIGSVVLSYNIPELSGTSLKLSGPVLANIYLGKITKWDDPAIKQLNPGANLPSNPITVVHRSDGSGTTFVFTDYLSNVSPEWKSKVGSSKSVQWPKGIGAPGNEGVSASISGSKYSIGYVELAYALTTKMNFASLQNKEGNFVLPTVNTTKAAVESSAPTLPKGDQPWTNVSLTNAPGQSSYPISTFTYIILHKDLSSNPSMNNEKAKAITDFLSWAITDGQKFSQPLGYVPLPDAVVKINQETLGSLTFKGTPLLTK